MMSPSNNLVQINGSLVDLTIVESTLLAALSPRSFVVKLVSFSTASRLALFFTGPSGVDEFAFLEATREFLLTCPSFPEPLATMISFAQQLTEMPVDEEGDVDISTLRSIAERRWGARCSPRERSPVLDNAGFGPRPLPPFARQPGTARIASTCSPGSTPSLLVGSSHFYTTPANLPPFKLPSILEISSKAKIALEIASHVGALLSLPASSSVSASLPLKLAGLNSDAAEKLYSWLQEKYEYDEDVTRLFEDNVSAWVIASHIVGGSAANSYSEAEFRSAREDFDDISLEAGISGGAGNEVRAICPNPVSYVFASWMANLIWGGHKKPLIKDDSRDPNPKYSSARIDIWISQSRGEYESFSKQSSKGLLRTWGSMMQRARGFIFTSAPLVFLSTIFGLFGSILMQQQIIVTNVGPRPTSPEGEKMFDDNIKQITGGVPLLTTTLWILALCVFGTKVFQTTLDLTSENIIGRTALDAKAALIGAVYKKFLHLGPQGNERFEKSYILNLISVDAEAVCRVAGLGSLTWFIPIQLSVAVYLLYLVIGVSVWASVGVLFGVLLVLILVLPFFFRTSAPMFADFCDKRMKMIKEIMEGMTLVKVRGWESTFLQRLGVARQNQFKYLRTFNASITIIIIVGQLANTLVPMATFSLFGEAEGGITAARVFPIISFSMVVEPLIALPQFLSTCAAATASWGRFRSFLIASEAAPVSPDIHLVDTDPIHISNGFFEWAKKDDTTSHAAENTKAFIHDINMSIKKGSLTAIVGPVGCGKSALFAAILGEMKRVSGEVAPSGTIAYCPQQPWIQSTTVEENITFGRPMDLQRFERAISATSFAADLNCLPNGIASEIAERGANLSGGQKARLSLARAVYADADIYLLDDPLAALDPRVGRAVFKECFLDVLHGKTRVLITQALNFLPQVDYIIVLNNGTIAEQGSYAQLYQQNGQLREMVDAVEGHAKKEVTKIERATKGEDSLSGNIVAGGGVTTGVIGGSTWWSYIRAAGGWKITVALVLSIASHQAATIMAKQWLTWWAAKKFQQGIEFWFTVYDGIGVATAFLMVAVNISILSGVLAASRTFHNKASSGVIGAPMGWFHTNPASRVVSHFSRDMETIDRRLVPRVFRAITGLGSLISLVFILSRSSPVTLGVLALLPIAYCLLFRSYLATLRELEQLGDNMKSSLHSKVNETLDGISTIAAFKREGDFAGSLAHLINESSMFARRYNTAETWFNLRVEIISALVVLIIVILRAAKITNNRSGLALAYASAFASTMSLLVKVAAAIESEMVAVRHLQEYSGELPKDAIPHLATGPAEGAWPFRGEIIFKGVEAAYPSRPEKPALKDVNIHIQPGTTVFIVGRTGSGKSTLLSVLLRLQELGKGNILIDGEDISKLGVHTLRRSMELVPQDPFIFSGTIRTVLDLEGRYDDASLWHALESVGLKDFVTNQENKLDTAVADNGFNYSVGERQLLCLAGAILRSPKILLLDNATASVDAGSDAFLQKTMRANCPGATILSVMHRLSNQVLKECDYVLVMNEGTPAEFDSPKALMENPDSLFSRIMEATRLT